MSGKNRRTWCSYYSYLVLYCFATTHGAFSFCYYTYGAFSFCTRCFFVLLLHMVLFRYTRCFFVLTKKHHGNVVFYLEIGSAPFTTHGARGASRCSRCFFGTPPDGCFYNLGDPWFKLIDQKYSLCMDFFKWRLLLRAEKLLQSKYIENTK